MKIGGKRPRFMTDEKGSFPENISTYYYRMSNMNLAPASDLAKLYQPLFLDGVGLSPLPDREGGWYNLLGSHRIWKGNNLKRYLGVILGFLTLVSLLLLLIAWRQAQRATVLVEWSTASELDTAGFNLYRSESAEGPFTKINSSLIPASQDPLSGSQYRYQDDQVQPDTLYYYQLEEVEMGGGVNRFGPISARSSDNRRLFLLTLGAGLLSLWLLARLAFIRRRNVRPTPEGK